MGKRALEDVATDAENKIFLTTSQLMSACRNFIKIHRDADDYVGVIPKDFTNREAVPREIRQTFN